MKHSKSILLLVLVGTALAIYYVVKQAAPQEQWPYKAPNAPAPRVKPPKPPAYFGLNKLLPEPKPVPRKGIAKKSSQPSGPVFFSFGEEMPAPQAPPLFFKASVYGAQKLHPESSVILKLEETCCWQGHSLKKGTLLYGTVRFEKQRVHLNLHTASHQGQRVAVRLTGYDTDYSAGLYAPGASPWQQARERLAAKAIGHTSGVLREVGSLALQAWQGLAQQKAIELLDRRPVLLAPSPQQKP